MIRFRTLLLGALCAVGVATFAIAADNSAPPAQQHHWRGHHGARMGSPFLHAVHQLNLTDDQKQRIHSLLSTEREAARSNASTQRANREALANPGDPNYAATVDAAKTAAANAVQERSNLEVQIYGLLTPDQQAQLPKVLADMKSRAEQRRLQWQQQHAANSAAG